MHFVLSSRIITKYLKLGAYMEISHMVLYLIPALDSGLMLTVNYLLLHGYLWRKNW